MKLLLPEVLTREHRAARVQPPREEGADTPDLKRLGAALERFTQRFPELPVLAIPWMHLRHPLGPVQERLLRQEPQAHAAFVSLVPRMLRCVLFGWYLSYWLLRVRWAVRRQLRDLKRQRFTVIARTCCFGPQPPADGNDFYFGDLQARLAKRGVGMLLLCGDSSGGHWLPFARGHIAGSGLCRLPEWGLVSPLAPIQMAVQQLRSCLRLRRRLRRMSEPDLRGIGELASRDCLSQTTALTGLMFWVGREAVRVWKPRALLSLYEGAAWEPCLWRGAKDIDPSCLTVGYQHTAIFPESRAMVAPPARGSWSCPNLVLGLGPIPLELLRAGHARHRTRMIRFGSFRHRSVGVRRPPEPARRSVLVVPEGIPSETHTLFTFAAACASRLPSYTFILRCHPQIPTALARTWVAEALRTQPNLTISEQGSIDEDFQRASVLLYRGSSSVLYAIGHGLLPMYYQAQGSRDRDPLTALDAWRRRCASLEDLIDTLADYERTDSALREAEWEAAARFVDRYTGPVTHRSIEALLEAIGVTDSALEPRATSD